MVKKPASPDSARSDTTWVRRGKPIKRKGVIEQIYSDVTYGGRELLRQMGTAVEKAKGGYRRVKEFLEK